MNDSFNFYNKKEEKESLLKKMIFTTFIKTLVVIILCLVSLIYIKQNSDNKKNFKKYVYTNSLSFAKIYSLYNKYIGDIIPFKNIKEKQIKVSNVDNIIYSDIKKENNGYVLTVSDEYSVSSLKSGIVVEVRKDDKYKNILTIQDRNGLNITYGYLDNINIKLYDYVKKGELIGNCNKKLYLVFKKGDKYLSYEKYL